jgi:hypothetical protein
VSNNHPEVVAHIAERLNNHLQRDVPSLSDDDSQGCDSVSLSGEWGLWNDVRSALFNKMLANGGLGVKNIAENSLYLSTHHFLFRLCALHRQLHSRPLPLQISSLVKRL